MDKAKILDLIECAKRESPLCWQEVALDWIHDAFAERGSHYTRDQVCGIVWRMTGVSLYQPIRRAKKSQAHSVEAA